MTGTDHILFTHKQSRSYLNHLVHMRKISGFDRSIGVVKVFSTWLPDITCLDVLEWSRNNKQHICVILIHNKTDNVSISWHWSAFANYCCRGKATNITYSCVRACVHVVLFIQNASRMRHIVTSFVAPLAPPYFSTLPLNGAIFEKTFLNVKLCFDFLYKLCLKHSSL